MRLVCLLFALSGVMALADEWRKLDALGAPQGNQIIVGNREKTFAFNYGKAEGRFYDRKANEWKFLRTQNAPPYGKFSLWTGSKYVYWENDLDGSAVMGTYDPATDTLVDLAQYASTFKSVPDGGRFNEVVWTGQHVLLAGAVRQVFSSVFDAALGSIEPAEEQGPWEQLPLANAPSARSDQTTIWTGEQLIAWGGRTSKNQVLGNGARFDLSLRQWKVLPPTSGEAARTLASGAWSGKEAVIIGGLTKVAGEPQYPTTYLTYDLATDRWEERRLPVGVKFEDTSQRAAFSIPQGVLVLGGTWCLQEVPCKHPAPGAIYDREKKTWREIAKLGAPDSMGKVTERIFVDGAVWVRDAASGEIWEYAF